MPTEDAAIDEIKALEDRRYRAMIAGDAAVLDELCSDDLIYTHSKADYDDKRSYLHKVGSRYFTYLEITHPADRILVVDGAALVTGRMTAKVLVAGTIVHVDNRYLAVWVREQGAWKFVAYQPTWREGASSHHRGYANESPAGAGAGLRQGLSGGEGWRSRRIHTIAAATRQEQNKNIRGEP